MVEVQSTVFDDSQFLIYTNIRPSYWYTRSYWSHKWVIDTKQAQLILSLQYPNLYLIYIYTLIHIRVSHQTNMHKSYYYSNYIVNEFIYSIGFARLGLIFNTTIENDIHISFHYFHGLNWIFMFGEMFDR